MKDRNQQSISSYAIDVSPLKLSKGQSSYFELEIQDSTDQSKALCFSPQTGSLLKLLAQMMMKALFVIW